MHFRELREERLNRENQGGAVDTTMTDRLARLAEKQAAEAEFRRRLQESEELLKRVYLVIPMVQKVVRQYCDAIFGNAGKYTCQYSFNYADLAAATIYGAVESKLGKRFMNDTNKFTLTEAIRLIHLLQTSDHYGIDATVVKNRGIVKWNPLHGSEYQVLLKSITFSVERGSVQDVWEGVTSSEARMLEVAITAEGIKIGIKPGINKEYTVQTEEELVETLTGIERELR